MFFVVVLVVVVIAAVIGAVVMTVSSRRRQEAISDYLSQVPEFSCDYIQVGEDGLSAIAVDEGRSSLCLIFNSVDGLSHRLLGYDAVISAQIHEDGSVVTSTSRSSQIAGAAVGGLLLGGVGAVVGTVTGKQKQIDRVTRVELRLIVDDVSRPTHDVVFQLIPSKRDGLIYQESIRRAREWHGRMEAVMHRSKVSPPTVT